MTAIPLPEPFLRLPLAHRGLHDRAAGRVENTLQAAQAAIEAGYGIELDVQPSRDGVAMVFHDAKLDRLTGQSGRTDARDAVALQALPLSGGKGACIPTLRAFLELVAGRVPLLIELKDQSGGFGPEDPTLPAAVAHAIEGYRGPLAVMSFNPHSVAHLARLAPKVARGLTTERFRAGLRLSPARAASLSRMEMFDQVGASFVSHDRRSLDSAPVAAMRARGVPVLTWTITSAKQEAQARRFADNITFEGYAAPSLDA